MISERRSLSLAGALVLVAAAYLAAAVTWTGAWREAGLSERDGATFSFFFYCVLPAILLLHAAAFGLLARRRGRSLREIALFPNPELWIVVAVTSWKFLFPLGRELERFPPFAHLHPVATTVGLMLLCITPLILVSRPLRFLLLFAFSAEVTALVLFDLAHLRHLNFLPSAADFEVRQVAMTWESFWASLKASDMLLVLDLPLWVVLYLTGGAPRVEPCSHRIRAALVAFLAALILVLPGSMIAGKMLRKENLNLAVRGETFTVNVLGLAGHHLMDLHIWRQGRRPIDPAAIEEVRHFVATRRGAARGGDAVDSTGATWNLVLVSFESLHEFALDLEVEGREVTPRLNQFARAADLRASLHDISGAGRSGDADFAAFHSLFPFEGGGTTIRFAGNNFHGLPMLLKERGFLTAAMSLTVRYTWNSHRLFPIWGFDHPLFLEDLRPPAAEELDDRFLYAKARERLREGMQEPFFLFLHTVSTHHPFLQAQHADAIPLGRFEGTLVGDYLRALHHADRAFGDFLDNLDQVGLLDRTMIVVYGDHDAGIYGAPGLESLLAGRMNDPAFYLQVDRVPLLLDLPGPGGGQQARANGSQVDIATTILPRLGIGTAQLAMVGVDLMVETSPPIVLPGGSIAAGDLLSIRNEATRSFIAYDLGTGRPLAERMSQELIKRAEERATVSRSILEGNLVP